VFPIECAPSQNVLKEMYVRPGAVPVGQVIQFYDMG